MAHQLALETQPSATPSFDRANKLSRQSRFDLRDSSQAYEFGRYVCREGIKTARGRFILETNFPIRLTLDSHLMSFKRNSLQDIFREGAINFQGCEAIGYKGGLPNEVLLMPRLIKSNAKEYGSLKNLDCFEIFTRHITFVPVEISGERAYRVEFTRSQHDHNQALLSSVRGRQTVLEKTS